MAHPKKEKRINMAVMPVVDWTYILEKLWETLVTFKKQALNRRNLRYFLYYALANFLILILYTSYERSLLVNLNLKPITSPQVEGSFLLFIVVVILMPFSLLFEELAFRFMPMVFIRDIFHLNRLSIVEGDRPFINHGIVRLWIYKHWMGIFIVVSAVWTALLHQINIIESSPLGALIYFAIQAFSGCCFAWIYAHRGLGSSWIIHTAWDFFLVALNLAILFIHA